MTQLRHFHFTVAGALLVALFACSKESSAYMYYSDDIGPNGQCAACHGAFNEGDIYVSNSEGVSWGADLHSVHLDNTTITSNPNGSCGNCHFGSATSGRQVNLQSSQDAKDGVNAIGCMGCHGRLEDGSPNLGAGLRAHHMGSVSYTNWPGGIPGSLTCANCHSGDPVPVSESTLPAWYASLTNEVVSLTMDPCNANGEENLAGLAQGLDNDGDQAYDTADSDCGVVAAVPGDSDGDGNSDILWRNNSNGQNSLWLMDGNVRIGQQMVPTVSDTNWQIVGRGDYNADGMADILWRLSNPGQADDGRMAVWLMQGGTRTANLALPTVPGSDWQVFGSGDSNGDGHADILWRNTANGQNAIWQLTNGQLTANLAVPSVSDLNWVIMSNNDFDNDGNADIMWRNASTGQNALWLMQGEQRLANEALPSVTGPNWQLLADGDYNDDGNSDLFWRNTATGLNAVWLMNGSTLSQNLPTPSFSNNNWQVVGGDGDYDGDGKADLLWREATTGENSMWLMSSGTRIGHGPVPAVPIGDWEVARID